MVNLCLRVIRANAGSTQFDHICELGNGLGRRLSSLCQLLLTGSCAGHQHLCVLNQSFSRLQNVFPETEKERLNKGEKDIKKINCVRTAVKRTHILLHISFNMKGISSWKLVQTLGGLLRLYNKSCQLFSFLKLTKEIIAAAEFLLLFWGSCVSYARRLSDSVFFHRVPRLLIYTSKILQWDTVKRHKQPSVRNYNDN